MLTGLKFVDGLLEASGCRRRLFTANPLQSLDERPAERRRPAALLGESFKLDLSEDRDLSRDGLAGDARNFHGRYLGWNRVRKVAT